MKLQPISIAIAILTTVALIACGGSADSTPTPNQVESALSALTTRDLEPLVLQREAYGTLVIGMSVTEGSGRTSNTRAAEDLAPLGTTTAEIDRLGRLGGHELGFETLDFEPGSIVELVSWVELFEEGADIEAFVDLNLEGLRADEEIEIIEFTEIDVPGVEQSRGWRILFNYEGLDEPIGFTLGTLQRGPLLAGVRVAEYGDSDQNATVIGLLQQLDDHVARTLAEPASAS